MSEATPPAVDDSDAHTDESAAPAAVPTSDRRDVPGSGVGVRRRDGEPVAPGPLATAAAVGAAVMAVTMQGDAVLLGVLLGVAAADIAAGAVGLLVAVAVLRRWGSASLMALAGGQAVIGPAGWTGTNLLVVSAWSAAAALVVAAPRTWLGPLAFGVAAAAVVAAPATGSGSATGTVALRLAMSVLLVAAAWACSRAVPRPVARPVAVVFAGIAVLAAAA